MPYTYTSLTHRHHITDIMWVRVKAVICNMRASSLTAGCAGVRLQQGIRLKVKLPCILTSYYCIKDKALAILVIVCVIGSMRLGGAWHLAGLHPSPRCSRGHTPQSTGPPALLNVTYGCVSDSYRRAQRSNRNSKDPNALKHKPMT
jgi:hypothetical protein